MHNPYMTQVYKATVEHYHSRSNAGQVITEEVLSALLQHSRAGTYAGKTDTRLAQVLRNVLQAWKAFYAARWQPSEPQLSSPGKKPLPWQAHYGRKMRVQRVFAGRARQDSFFGHKGGIKCLGLLPGHNIMATGTASYPSPST